LQPLQYHGVLEDLKSGGDKGVEYTRSPIFFVDIYRQKVIETYNRLVLTGLPERDPRLHEIKLDNSALGGSSAMATY